MSPNHKIIKKMPLAKLALVAACLAVGASGLVLEGQAHEKGSVERELRILGGFNPPEFVSPDANADGFVSRDEARATAERLFDHRDRNDDAKLDPTDRPERGERREERRIVIEKREGGASRVEEIDIERRGRGGPPMPGLMLMNSEEADLNRDGSLSKEEFVSQQLRFFDAGDVNGDGKIQFDPPPKPPAPPEPPAPPAPPAPPRR